MRIPKGFDERVQHIQLYVIRDAFITVLIMALLFVTGLAFFPTFVTQHSGEIGLFALVCVGLVACISNYLRGGWQGKHERSFARGDILLAPLLAAIVTFLTVKLTGQQLSFLEWLLWYMAMLIGFLAYSLFTLYRQRKRA